MLGHSLIFQLADSDRLDVLATGIKRETIELLEFDENFKSAFRDYIFSLRWIEKVKSPVVMFDAHTFPSLTRCQLTHYERVMFDHLQNYLLPELAKICLEYTNHFAQVNRCQCIVTCEELIHALETDKVGDSEHNQRSEFKLIEHMRKNPEEKEMIVVLF